METKLFKDAVRPVRGAYYGTRGPSPKSFPGSSWVLPRQPWGGPGGAPAAWLSVRWGVWARSAIGAVLCRWGRRRSVKAPPPHATPSALSISLLQISVYTRKSHRKKTRDY